MGLHEAAHEPGGVTQQMVLSPAPCTALHCRQLPVDVYCIMHSWLQLPSYRVLQVVSFIN